MMMMYIVCKVEWPVNSTPIYFEGNVVIQEDSVLHHIQLLLVHHYMSILFEVRTKTSLPTLSTLRKRKRKRSLQRSMSIHKTSTSKATKTWGGSLPKNTSELHALYHLYYLPFPITKLS